MALCNLVVRVCVKFEECTAKAVGGVGFLVKSYFSFSQCCQFLAYGCQNWDILMCVNFGDYPISSLDFSFIGEGESLGDVSLYI